MTEEDKKIVTEAYKRYEYFLGVMSENHNDAREAIKFRLGEQWPDKVKSLREGDKDGARPCLVMDKTNQHIRQVCNDQRQNRPAIKVRPYDSGSDPEVAEVLQGIIRHVENTSCADVAYDTAFEHAVEGGFGYFRIYTDYADDGFQQEIKVSPVRNRFSAFLDPTKSPVEGYGPNWGGFIDIVEKEEAERLYGKGLKNFQSDDKAFCDEEHIAVLEYFRAENTKKTIYQLDDGSVVDALPDGVSPKNKRELDERKVVWYKIVGDEIKEKTEFASKYIPIVEVVGEEINEDGKRLLRGMIKPAMDPQRVHNYAASAFVETVALAPRAPWIAEENQVEGYESLYKESNVKNIGVLPYKARAEQGQLLPPPQRVQPAGIPTGWDKILANTEHDIQGAMGRYAASLGQPSNETSGTAIANRNREGDVATYHYTDNLSRALIHAGKIYIDMIPRVFDIKTVVRILKEDGDTQMVELNPTQDAPKVEERQEDGGIKKIYNIGMGKYDVTVTTGPSYTTKRQESAVWMSEIMKSNPDMMQVAGDLLFKNMDLPGAEEISERLKRTMRPEIVGKDGVSPEIAQAQAMIKIAQDQMMQKATELHDLKMEADKAMSEVKIKMSELRAVESEIRNEQQAIALQKQSAVDQISAKTIKLEADRAKIVAELQLLEAELEAKAKENEHMEVTKERDHQQMQEMEKMHAEMMQSITQAIALISAPRKTTLLTDASGMPVGSTSEVIVS